MKVESYLCLITWCFSGWFYFSQTFLTGSFFIFLFLSTSFVLSLISHIALIVYLKQFTIKVLLIHSIPKTKHVSLFVLSCLLLLIFKGWLQKAWHYFPADGFLVPLSEADPSPVLSVLCSKLLRSMAWGMFISQISSGDVLVMVIS